MLKYFFTGVFTKLITGFDDTLVHVPLVTRLTRTRIGKVAFAIGIFLAICFAIVISLFFSSVLRAIPYYRSIVAGLIFILAFVILFDIFKKRRLHKTKIRVNKVKKAKKISHKRFIKLVIIGFLAAFATVLDDIIAYSSILLRGGVMNVMVIGGILLATLLEVSAVVYFSRKISKFRFRKEVSFLGLVILGLLIIFNVI